MLILRALWFQEIKKLLTSYKIVTEKYDRETNERTLSIKIYYIYYIRIKFHGGSETEMKFQGEKEHY